MEVVACFLKKHFSLLANGEITALKELYHEDAIVSVSINGEVTEGKGSSLLETIAPHFADGVVTLKDVNKFAGNDAVAIVSTGIVSVNDLEINFTQKVTLFNTAKHWYIGFEQLELVIPTPVEVEEQQEAEEEEEEVAAEEEEQQTVEKQPTPQRSPALKPKEPEAAKVIETPAPAPKSEPPVSSWAAAVTSKTAPAPKVLVATTPAAPVVAKPVVPVAEVKVYFAVPIVGNARLEKEKDVRKLKEVILGEVSAQLEKINITKRDFTSLRVITNETRANVFVDFVIPDALEKVQSLSIFGNRVNPTLQKKNA